MGHALGENRHGLIIGVTATEASGTAEREAALVLLTQAKRRHRLRTKTLGADKGYDAGPFYRKLERRQVTPHVPIVKPPRDPKAVPRNDQVPDIWARRLMQARMGTAEYASSQWCRKKVEEGIGWIKTVAGLARSCVVGRWKLRQLLEVAAAAYNLVRLKSLVMRGCIMGRANEDRVPATDPNVSVRVGVVGLGYRSVAGPLANSVPFALFAAVGLLRLRGGRRG